MAERIPHSRALSRRSPTRRALVYNRPLLSQDTESRIRFTDPGLIRERVVSALRDAIIAGRLKPGERIRERELVALLGVSRSPLREAIRILETEGLITSLAHRGGGASEVSATDLRDMLHVRIMLESFAARLFIERLDDRALQAMQDQVERA